MKRCPECRRDYYDDTLLYCLDDGNALLEGPASASNDEPATAILSGFGVPPSGGPSSESPTRAQINTTDQTAILPTGTGDVVPKPRGLNKRLLAPFLLAIVVLGGFFGYRYLIPAGTEQINSIAVLPFENRSGNADTDYLSDGLAESLIYRLSQLPNLKVSPTSSVFRYKGKETDPQVIAKELGVDSVMTGRITQRGDSLTISVNLVDTRNGKSLWGEQYERKLSELLTTQREIVAEIVGKLQLKLSGESEQKLAKKYTDNPEAYQLYLQGRFHWNKRTSADFEQAVVFFKKAIEKDPNYALAYAGLADTYALFPDWVNGRPKEYMPQAKQAALKALELDPNLAEAHASLALITYYYDYDPAGAERSFKRSIELNPKYPSARQWYGNFLIWAGRQDEGLRENLKAAELDPFSKIIIWNLGSAFQFNGQYDEAIRQYQKIIELFSDQRINDDIGNTYATQGKYQQAVEAYLNGYRFAKEIKPEEIQKLKESFEKGGWESFGRAKQEIDLSLLKASQAKDPNGYIKPYEIAKAYSWGKDKDKVIEYLNKAYEDRSADVFRLRTDFTFAGMRDDPRFKELVKRVGIPE